jgi:hypothetical protein
MVTQLQSRVELEERRDLLRNRLEDGWTRLDEAEAAGQHRPEWDDFWLQLLAEYEAICRQIDAADGISRQPSGGTPMNAITPMHAMQQPRLGGIR